MRNPPLNDFSLVTLRDIFAGMAMQGLLSSPETFDSLEKRAEVSVKVADALLAELEKKEACDGK